MTDINKLADYYSEEINSKWIKSRNQKCHIGFKHPAGRAKRVYLKLWFGVHLVRRKNECQ